jgi:hypothetical protein
MLASQLIHRPPSPLGPDLSLSKSRIHGRKMKEAHPFPLSPSTGPFVEPRLGEAEERRGSWERRENQTPGRMPLQDLLDPPLSLTAPRTS